MACIVIILGSAHGDLFDQPGYLVSFDPTLPPTDPNMIHISLNRADAKQFLTTADAFAYWQTTHKLTPKRRDGMPNRPLTAYTIQIEKL